MNTHKFPEIIVISKSYDALKMDLFHFVFNNSVICIKIAMLANSKYIRSQTFQMNSALNRSF